jgi:ParB/RepB/Spo0J family partition protein
MKQTEIEPEKQGKHYDVDVRKIRPLQRAGGNPRTDYGDLEELAADILQNGVVTPLRGFRLPDKSEHEWEITAGHRRLAACMLLVERGHVIRVKIFSIGDAKTITDEKIIMEHFTTNSGKPFTIVEMAETIRRLVALDWKSKDIATRLGKSQRFVQNMINFSSAPLVVRKMVSDGRISYTTVLEIFRDSVDWNEVRDKIEAAAGVAKTNKKPVVDLPEDEQEEGYTVSDDVHAKVTKRHVDKITNRVDSFKELQMVFKNQIDEGKEPANHELYSFLKKLIENKLSRTHIERALFES